MTAKEYLRQITDIEKCIELNNRNIERWRAELLNCTADPSREFVSGGGSNDACFTRLIEDVEDAVAENSRLIRFRNKIMVEIAEEPARYSEVLYAVYVNRRSLLEFAFGVGESYDWVRHKHLDALEHFEKNHSLKNFRDDTLKHN